MSDWRIDCLVDMEIPIAGNAERPKKALDIAWGYMLAKVGRKKVIEEFDKIVWVYNNKGCLYVIHDGVMVSPLIVEAINAAWEECSETTINYVSTYNVPDDIFDVIKRSGAGLRERKYRGISGEQAR